MLSAGKGIIFAFGQPQGRNVAKHLFGPSQPQHGLHMPKCKSNLIFNPNLMTNMYLPVCECHSWFGTDMVNWAVIAPNAPIYPAFCVAVGHTPATCNRELHKRAVHMQQTESLPLPLIFSCCRRSLLASTSISVGFVSLRRAVGKIRDGSE